MVIHIAFVWTHEPYSPAVSASEKDVQPATQKSAYYGNWSFLTSWFMKRLVQHKSQVLILSFPNKIHFLHKNRHFRCGSTQCNWNRKNAGDTILKPSSTDRTAGSGSTIALQNPVTWCVFVPRCRHCNLQKMPCFFLFFFPTKMIRRLLICIYKKIVLLFSCERLTIQCFFF